MNLDQAREMVTAMRTEAATLPLSTSSAEFTSLRSRTRSVLTRALGETHHITEGLVAMKWTPSAYVMGDATAFADAFQAAGQRALGLLDAALSGLVLLADEVPMADETGIDAEMLAHIAPEIQAEAWAKVAGQAVIFTEDRIRTWAGRPVSEVGKDLAVAVLGDNASSGCASRRRDSGLAAVRPRHRPGAAQRRRASHPGPAGPQAVRARGGGACSLLLTQMRYEHGNRFRDTSSATPAARSGLATVADVISDGRPCQACRTLCNCVTGRMSV